MVKKNYFDSNMIQKGDATLLQHFLKDYFAADVDRSKCLLRRHQTRSSACTMLVTRFITNFAHDDVSYRNNREIINIMLE